MLTPQVQIVCFIPAFCRNIPADHSGCVRLLPAKQQIYYAAMLTINPKVILHSGLVVNSSRSTSIVHLTPALRVDL